MTDRRTNYCLTICLLLNCLVSCRRDQEPAATSSTAQAYVDAVLGEMQNYSVNRKTIEWPVFKGQVRAKLQGAQTIADTYPAIQLALTLLGDNHSTYTTATGTLIYGTRRVICTDGTATAVPANSKIGYVRVTGFSGSGLDATNFAQSIQSGIRQADSDSVQGWIVDLRDNAGGNMWPMLAGIGPILGEGIAGYFILPDGNTTSWSYQNGSALMNQIDQVKIVNPYKLRQPAPKVAVLTNRVTASSGEAIAISFKGRLGTRSFGAPTCGLSTANATKVLSDGAILNLTQGTLSDRNKTLYGDQVQPGEALYTSSAVDRAVAWLLQ